MPDAFERCHPIVNFVFFAAFFLKFFFVFDIFFHINERVPKFVVFA